MSAEIGRDMLIKKNNTSIAGVRSKSFTVNNEPVDITSDDDNGFRTMLGDVGVASIDISVEGVTNDSVLAQAALGASSKLLTDITLETMHGTISGDFYLNSYAETGPTGDAVTFTASLQSSGSWSVST